MKHKHEGMMKLFFFLFGLLVLTFITNTNAQTSTLTSKYGGTFVARAGIGSILIYPEKPEDYYKETRRGY